MARGSLFGIAGYGWRASALDAGADSHGWIRNSMAGATGEATANIRHGSLWVDIKKQLHIMAQARPG